MENRTPLAKVHIGQVIRHAIAFDFKRHPNGLSGQHPMDLDSLLQPVETLFELLDQRGVEYLLVGGIAMLQYVEGRNTEDIDLIMALNQLKSLTEIKLTDQNAYFARGTFDTLQIDLLLTENKLFEHVQQNYATEGNFVERTIPCATVEGLLLLKLYALPSLYRQGNFARVGLYENDVATLLQGYNPEIEPLLDELSRHLSGSDMAEVNEILSEIQKRIRRFGDYKS